MISLRSSALVVVMAAMPAVAACKARPWEASRPATFTAMPASGEPPVQWTKDDPEMEAAVARARETLPVFWRVFDERSADKGSDYILKAGFPNPQGGEEHMWFDVQARAGDKVTGVLGNEPQSIPGLHDGDLVTVQASQISDWSYVKHGRRYGAFTERVMVNRMSPKDAADYGSELSETPLEPGRN